MKKLSALVVGLTLAAGTTAASAAQIEGEFSFDGGGTSWAPLGEGTVADGTVDGIDFLGGGTPGEGTIEVTSSSGDFAANGVVDGVEGTINDFSFDPFAGPIEGFWEVGDFNFDLEAITEVQFGPSEPFSVMIVTGEGTVDGTGFDPTPGRWVFSGNTFGGTFSFSASTITQPTQVPVPATLGLLGLGLVGLGAATRLRRRAA
jgi:hypothetical protein